MTFIRWNGILGSGMLVLLVLFVAIATKPHPSSSHTMALQTHRLASTDEISTTVVPTSTVEPVSQLFLAYLPAEPSLPACNHFALSDVPDNQTLLQSVNSTCYRFVGQAQDGDDDYYMVDLQAGETLTITLTHIPDGADYDLVLYDEALDNYLAYSTGRNQADEQIVYTVSAAGNYYIRVILHDTAFSNRYHLCVMVGMSQTRSDSIGKVGFFVGA